MIHPHGRPVAVVASLEDPDCAGLFNTDGSRTHKYSPKSVLSPMLYGRPVHGAYIGRVRTDRIKLDWLAVTDPDKALSVGDLATTLLHELGHVFDIVSTLGGSEIKNDINSDGSINWSQEEADVKALENCKL